MKSKKIFKLMSRFLAVSLFGYAYFMADPVFAMEISAEYKCTSRCSLCITYDNKKTVCSEKYDDESEEYEKAKKLSRFVNEGLIIPTADIKQGFSLNAFANKFFNCEFMIKKAEQIKQAAENMCVRKTVKRESYVPRQQAGDDEPRESRRRSSAKESRYSDRGDEASDRRPASRDREKTTGTSLREQKKAKRAKREAESHEGEELTPPPANDSMDDLIKQMED